MSTLQSRPWAVVSAAVVSFGCPGLSIAANLNVPADYPTIQSCIDAAVSGVDECVVSPGTYHETINYLGKAITLRSSGGRDVTTIDATGIGGSVVTCASGEGPDTVLDGFTITGGTGIEGLFYDRLGGGMYNYNSSPTVTDCTFIANKAIGSEGFGVGGGMSNLLSSPTVTNCTFSGNSSAQGGGMGNVNSSPTVIQCSFIGNSATDSGGGMANLDSSPKVTHCTFSRNTARSGGGMYNDNSSPMVTACAFSGNRTYYGGGMYNVGSSPAVTNCTFCNNTCFDFGGGMYNYRSSPTVTNCALTGNTATAGGGMANEESSKPTVTECTFSANTATHSGGGMYNYHSRPTVMNCALTGNTATGYYYGFGGGMFNYSSTPIVTNCTFSANTVTGSYSAEGGGIFNVYSSTPTLTNCVLWGDSPDEVMNIDTSVSVIHFSDVQGGLPSGAIDGGGNIDLDPMFVRPPDPGPDGMWDGVDDDYGDLRLSSGSPCINAGDPAFVPQPGETDLDGHTRVLCERVDMGAYEFGIGDYDCNQTVNLSDFSAWPGCMTGPLVSHVATEPRSHEETIHNRQLAIGNRQLAINCEAFDFDADGDVDLHDYYLFSQVFTGP